MNDYYHDDQIIDGFRDYRNDNSQPPALSKMYYIVFRIKTGNSVWYHHTAMAVDDDLSSHVESMKCILRASLNRPKAEISCVFVRSLVTQDSSVLNSSDKQHLVGALNAKLADGNLFDDAVEQFLVFGFDGNNTDIVSLNIPSEDAMEAGSDAIHLFADQWKIDLQPFDIIAVSPAIPSIVSLFDKKVHQLLEHVNSSFATDRHITG